MRADDVVHESIHVTAELRCTISAGVRVLIQNDAQPLMRFDAGRHLIW